MTSEVTMKVEVGMMVRLEIKPERTAEFEARLRASVAEIGREAGTPVWLGLRLGPTSYAVVDVFPDEAAREIHRVAGEARIAQIQHAFAEPPAFSFTEVVAAKIPAPREAADCRDANKATVLAFYEHALNRKDFAAASHLLGARYVQHDPRIGDGKEGLEAFVRSLRERFPELRAEVKRIIAEGNLVMAHVHGVREPGQRGLAIVDIFALEDGKIVEHWDVMQPLPDEEPANANGMF
jgi:predicted SnoaL-like aldol condensation-catalyzing enzyme